MLLLSDHGTVSDSVSNRHGFRKPDVNNPGQEGVMDVPPSTSGIGKAEASNG